jgi:hypothetical protein
MMAKTPLVDLTPPPYWVLQTLHVFMGSWIVLTAVLTHYPPLTGVLAALTWATVKEFTWDMIFEVTTWSEEAMDWAWYMIGALWTAAALIWLHT